MATFNFGVTVPLPPGAIVSAALGASDSTPLTDKDRNKAVKFGADSTYEIAGDGEPLEGVLQSTEPHTTNGGFGFGSVLRWTPGYRIEAKVASGETVALGNRVVCAAQESLGDVQEFPLIRAATADSTPAVISDENYLPFAWRVVALPEGGTAGSVVIIEAY